MTISHTKILIAIAFASSIIVPPAQAWKGELNENCWLQKIENDGSGNKTENDGSGNKTENDGSGKKLTCQISFWDRLLGGF